MFGDASFQKDDGSAKLEPSLWDTLMTALSRSGTHLAVYAHVYVYV